MQGLLRLVELLQLKAEVEGCLRLSRAKARLEKLTELLGKEETMDLLRSVEEDL